MSVSKQYAQIGVPPRTNKKRKAQTETQVVTVTKKSRSPVGAQIPRGFVTPLAMDSKFFDPAANTTVTLATGGNVTHLDVVTRGDAVNQRNGKTWQNINIQFRGRVFAGVQALLNHVAIYLIWDRQPNKALATVAAIVALVKYLTLPAPASGKKIQPASVEVVPSVARPLSPGDPGAHAPNTPLSFQ